MGSQCRISSAFFISRHHNRSEAKVLHFPVLEWLQKVQCDCCAVHWRNHALPLQHTKGKGAWSLTRLGSTWAESCGFHRWCSPLLQSDSDRDHKVRLAMGNGIRADTWTDFLSRFGNIRVCECYGATEGTIGFVNYIGKVGAIGKEHFLHKVPRMSFFFFFFSWADASTNKSCSSLKQHQTTFHWLISVIFYSKMAYSYALIRYDTEKEEPVRNSKGFCIEVPRGEPVLDTKASC